MKKPICSLLILILCLSTEGILAFQVKQEFSVTDKVQNWKSITVTASAYNSLENQGEGNPAVTASGDTLVPGMKSIAVSVDLLEKGLIFGTTVKIEGFEGLFVVNDKMHSRWRNKIDIYMGENREKALEWGRRKVKIWFLSHQQ